MVELPLARQATASEAVIEEARRRQRRRRLGVACVVLVVAATAAVLAIRGGGNSGEGGPTAAGGVRLTPAQTATCLRHHRALVRTARPIRAFGSVPTISVSFALVPGQRRDALTISFARDAADADAAVAALVRRFEAKAPGFGDSFLVERNAIVYWQSPDPSAASRATVGGCL